MTDSQEMRNTVDIASLKADLRWHRLLILGLYGAIIGLHFIDPSQHFLIFQYP